MQNEMYNIIDKLNTVIAFIYMMALPGSGMP